MGRPIGGVGRALGWSTVAQGGRQVVQVLTTIALARLLLPEDFGLVGIALVVVGVITIFKDLGTGAAVIQRPDASAALLSTVFWSNLLFGAAAALVLGALAPLIADVFREPTLVEIIRALAVSLVISSVAVVPQALLERRLRFGDIARIELTAVVCGGVTAVVAALAGAGAWSLVVQTTVAVVVSALLLFRVGGFRPARHWDRADMRSVAGFSVGLTGFNLFNYAARNADNILIGRVFGATALGLYALAYRLMLYPLQSVTWTVNRVMYPVYAGFQDDDGALRDAYLRSVGLVGFVAFPMVAGLGAVADRLVATLFGPEWATSATILMVLVPVAAIQVVVATVGPIYQAKDRPRALLGWGVVSGTATVFAFVIGLAGGVVGVAVAYLAVTALLALPALIIPYRMIDLHVGTALGAVARSALSAALMASVVWLAGRALPTPIGDPFSLIVLIGLGAIVYLALATVIERDRVVAAFALARRAREAKRA